MRAINDITYSEYLRLDLCLSAQSPLSELIEDENHFIITHQSIELWFKLIVGELNRLNVAIVSFEWDKAYAASEKIIAFVNSILIQIKNLNLLAPQSFHSFRKYLGTASGIQSVQYREIEVISGVRDRAYLERLYASNDAYIHQRLDEILNKKSVAENLEQAIKLSVEGGILTALKGPDRYPEINRLIDSLLRYDQAWSKFRYEHLLLVERMIGKMVMGTSGQQHQYLANTIERKFFNVIWDSLSILAKDTSYNAVTNQAIKNKDDEKVKLEDL